MPKISVENLNFYYGTFLALTGLSVEIDERKITALIGPSGCGKSTFLRCLNRMNDTIRGTRMTGTVLLDNQDIYTPGTDVVDLRRRVGMVFQRPNPFPQSVFDNVAFGPRVLGLAKSPPPGYADAPWPSRSARLGKDNDVAAIVEDSLRAADLWDEVRDHLRRDALSLSLGQQQRLCIARVIAVKPEVILMDEPCSALDPIATLRIEDLMRVLKESYTIVIVTHNMQQAARVSDQTGFFWVNQARSGILVEYGPTRQIFTHPRDKRTEDYITGRFG